MSDIEQPMPVTRAAAWKGTDAYEGRRRNRPRRDPAARDPHNGGSEGDRVSLHGVDPANVTPEIQGLIDGLMAEVDSLRWRLTQAEHRQGFLEDLADQDAWLPTLNRRAFLRDLGRFLDRAGAQPPAGAVALIYLDNFDTLRRQAGLSAAQEALRHLARHVVGSLRAADVVGRVGGAGLAVLMTTAHLDGARAKVERLVAAMANRPLTLDHMTLPLHPVFVLRPLVAGDTAEGVLAEAEEMLRGLG